MKKYEYKYHAVDQNTIIGLSDLNRFGQLGWELVAIEPKLYTNRWCYIFKREIEEKSNKMLMEIDLTELDNLVKNERLHELKNEKGA